MKVITRCIIQISSLKIVEEDSYKYYGPVAECKGGGGGGSGKVEFPAYLQTIHGDWLDNGGVDTMTSSMTDLINAAVGASPFAAATAYNPSTEITAIEAAVTAFTAIVAALVDATSWETLFTQAETSIDDFTNVDGITEAVIVADVDAFADQLDDEIANKILPRFRRGMQDINAVVSSAFPIGEALIEGFRNREVAKHNSAIRLEAASKNADIEISNVKLHNEVKNLRLSATEQMLNLLFHRIAWREAIMKVTIEGQKIKIIASKEENDLNIDIDENDALWDLEAFQYGANLIGAIGGGTAVTKMKRAATWKTVLGNVLGAGGLLGGIDYRYE